MPRSHKSILTHSHDPKINHGQKACGVMKQPPSDGSASASSGRRWWRVWAWSEPVSSSSQDGGGGGASAADAAAPSTSTSAVAEAIAPTAAVGEGSVRPRSRGEGPPMGLLGASALGIFGCGIMAGMYKAQRSEEGGLFGGKKKRAKPRLKPEEAVKHWPRPAATVQGPFGLPIPPDFNPTRLATKALAIGTVLCLSVAGGAAFVVGRAMGVRDVYEFVDEVRAWAPRKRRELEAWAGLQPNRALEAERAAVAGMSYEEEMAHWETVVLAEGEKEKGREGQ